LLKKYTPKSAQNRKVSGPYTGTLFIGYRVTRIAFLALSTDNDIRAPLFLVLAVDTLRFCHFLSISNGMKSISNYA